MDQLEGKSFFNNIRRSVKISYFVASVIPLALLVYFSLKYVYPYITAGDITKTPISIGVLLLLAVALSVLGLLLTTKATNASISEAQDLNKKLNSLFEITRQFRETVHLDELLQKILKSAISLTSAETGSLLMYDEENTLRFNVTVDENAAKINGSPLNSGQSIAAWVTENRQPALVNDISSDSRYSNYYDDQTGFKTSSILCVPLIYAGTITGAIELRNKRNGVFTLLDQSLLHNLADQAAISIDQNSSNEKKRGDLIHITEMLVNAQDYIQNNKGHARRVAYYANAIGKYMECSDSALKNLYHASLLHDIGLLKTGANSNIDLDVHSEHPIRGYELMKSISLWSDSAEIVRYHHSEYENTMTVEIPLGARILAAAEALDVLTNRYASSEENAQNQAFMEITTGSGSIYDPQVVSAIKAAIIDSGLPRPR
ncbi:MAG: GAF domain-containing protein [Nitrospira sp.]|nr:GAF domain-containing protein [bacterium]MBL7049161.1 GAF domain-containing protein [Nitrospira sp.]